MFWCDGKASESVLARYFDPKLGRFLTQDSYLGEIDEPPSLHRYLYANANPLRFIDLTGLAGFEAKAIQYEGFRPSPFGYTEALEFSQEVTVTASPDASYAVPQQIGHRVGGLNRAAETTARGAGVAGLAVGAGVLAVAPVPGARAGAVYLGIRAVDEGQAFVREQVTGVPTESEAHQGLRIALEEAGVERKDAGFYASVGLGATDAAVGVAGFRSLQQGQQRAGVVTESAGSAEATMAPAEGVARPTAPAARRTYAVGERMPDGRLAGEGPGAARRGGSEFPSGGTRAKADATRVGSTRHVDLEVADQGSYTIEFESGKGYAGKGGTARARRSARQRSREHADPVRDIEHTPAQTNAEALVQEAERLEALGGPESPTNYNRINSPGKKLKER